MTDTSARGWLGEVRESGRGKEQVCIKQRQSSCYIQRRIKSSAGLMLGAKLDVFAKDDMLNTEFIPNHGC